MKRYPAHLCTPAAVGILNERGLTQTKIANKFGVSVRTIQRYWKEWREATYYDQQLARMGTKI